VGTVAILGSAEHGLHIVDLQDPLAPQTLEVYDPGVCTNGTPFGKETQDFAIEDVEIDGSLAYLSLGRCGLWIVDLNDLSSAPLAVVDSEGWTEAARVVGTLAFVADYNGGLLILDVADPADPQLLSLFAFDDAAFGPVLDVDVAGGFAYVASVEGLRVLDVSDPSAPLLVGSFEADTASGEIPQDVMVLGQFALVPGWMGGLLVFDVTDPLSPSLAASVPTGLATYRVAVDGALAYVVEGSDGVLVLDISNVVAPARLDRIDLGKFVWDVQMMNGSVVVSFGDTSTNEGGLQVIVDR
jgi:hypothetical protein